MNNKKFNKTYLLLVPQELKPTDNHSNYINTDILSKILNDNGWTKIKYHDINFENRLDKKHNHNNIRYLNNVGIGFIYNTGTDPYNTALYKTPCYIKNLFNVRVHREITNKESLYYNFEKIFKKNNDNFMSKTWNLNNLKQLPHDGVFLAKPVSGWKGLYIEVINDNNGLLKYKHMYGNIIEKIKNKKITDFETVTAFSKGVILCEYFVDPLLFKNLKFHIRSYMMIRKYKNTENKYTWDWSFFPQAKILTAKLPYVKKDWANKEIHDTHVGSTQDDYYFPQDFNFRSDILKYIYTQINIICKAVFILVRDSDMKTYDEAVNSFEVLGLDFMILENYDVKILEVNNKLGYGVIHRESNKVKTFTYDFFKWIYDNAIKNSGI